MLRRVSICGVVLALVAPVSAQQLAQPEPNEPAIKFQVKNFELVLRLAVNRGAQDVADHARAIVPDLQLAFLSDVTATGWWTPDFGYTFDVVIPGIGATSARLFQMIQTQPQSQGMVMPVGSTGTSATSGARADPMIASSVAPYDPNKEYAEKVRLALVDALVENSAALQFGPGQRLQIAAGPPPQDVPNPLVPDSRRLILTVKGEDLIAFRQGKLKREELLAAIMERRF